MAGESGSARVLHLGLGGGDGFGPKEKGRGVGIWCEQKRNFTKVGSVNSKYDSENSCSSSKSQIGNSNR